MAKKILIVDDDKRIALLLASRLKANRYEISVAYDAIQAVAKAVKEKPDLIILDIKMPAGGGMSVMENLGNSADTAVIPVIAITAYPGLEVQRRAKELGAVAFFSKPFKAEDILLMIKKILEQSSQEG